MYSSLHIRDVGTFFYLIHLVDLDHLADLYINLHKDDLVWYLKG